MYGVKYRGTNAKVRDVFVTGKTPNTVKDDVIRTFGREHKRFRESIGRVTAVRRCPW